MTRARQRAYAISLVAAALIALLILAALWDRPIVPSARSDQAPRLLLVTSLPIIFNEDFSLSGGGSPVLEELGKAYRVVPISVTSQSELAKGDLLLMAHAPAQTAENLVALDKWVRRGGRVLILADPLLEWPSKRPLGDPLRPSPMFMDTGLLAHWGLQLAGPERRGEQSRDLGRFRVATLSPGYLSGACDLAADGFEARCSIGKGRAIVLADADFLNTPALGPASRHNLDALMEQLASLRRS